MSTAAERTEDVSNDEPPSQPAVLGGGHCGACAPAEATPLRQMLSEPQWGDWQWQMRHRIRSVSQLHRMLPALTSDAGIAQASQRFPLAITPYYASLIERLDPSDPVFAMSVPQAAELCDPPFLADDPLEEDHDMPVPGLVHRYPDRALLIATTTCAMYCRHCTRKRAAGHRESCISTRRLRQVVAYLQAHPEIHDVIVSGGDPLTMATDALDRVLTALRTVSSVEILRIGTRTPVTLPMRITPELVAMLRRHPPLWLNTHFNHPCELTPEAVAACERLVDAGIPVGNQSVLLRGINDDPETMASLCRGLVRMRVRPYYLFQCDLVRGVEHFRTPLSRGVQIMEALRGQLSGLAIPTFVVDAPHGGGKIPVLPTYIVSVSPTHTVLRNFEGMLVSYPEPHAASAPPSGARDAAPRVHDLATGRATAIQPARSDRHTRRQARRTDAPQLVESQ